MTTLLGDQKNSGTAGSSSLRVEGESRALAHPPPQRQTSPRWCNCSVWLSRILPLYPGNPCCRTCLWGEPASKSTGVGGRGEETVNVHQLRRGTQMGSSHQHTDWMQGESTDLCRMGWTQKTQCKKLYVRTTCFESIYGDYLK